MSGITPLPPAGWYDAPDGTQRLQWWDGTTWKNEYELLPPKQKPVEAPVALTRRERLASATADPSQFDQSQPKKYYWSNLLRFRFLWFLFAGPLVAAIGLGLLSPILVYSYFIILPLMAWFLLQQQMACRHCGRTLAVTKLGGAVEVCKSCRMPTDAGLRTFARKSG